ncbi:hypothetical protein [Halorhabdus amylolytica]|uniref:hypothetical protein n=1 Tax=Halorhabdus amylolytica TaxID=2559573 RepID=UPI0010AA950A|nr:hypothetical protein [Halorhabdus amylolytica]
MDRTERALASFLGDDEELVETWTVDTIIRGFELSPPGMGPTETLGLTDRRLLWLDEDLETVEFEDVEAIKTETMQSGTGSAILRLGVLSLAIGILATIALWLFMSFSPLLTAAPFGVGVVTFALSVVTARLRDDDEAGETYHYLAVQTSRTTLQVYATEATVETIVDQINAQRKGDPSDEESENTNADAEPAG